jgi:hypothetical protein
MSQSTIWTQLSSPNSPAGSIPYVTSDGVTIGTDVLNLSYFDGKTTPPVNSSIKPFQLTVEGGLRECSDDLTQQPAAANYTINKPIGKVLIPAGALTTRVSNTYCAPGAIVLLQLETNDATLTHVIPALGNGAFNINGNAVATANVRVAFMIVNTF